MMLDSLFLILIFGAGVFVGMILIVASKERKINRYEVPFPQDNQWKWEAEPEIGVLVDGVNLTAFLREIYGWADKITQETDNEDKTVDLVWDDMTDVIWDDATIIKEGIDGFLSKLGLDIEERNKILRKQE